jgi:hypothetical protein
LERERRREGDTIATETPPRGPARFTHTHTPEDAGLRLKSSWKPPSSRRRETRHTDDFHDDGDDSHDDDDLQPPTHADDAHHDASHDNAPHDAHAQRRMRP